MYLSTLLFLDFVYKAASDGSSGFDWWTFLKDLLTAISGFILLWIAIRSYFNQDVKKNILDKQFETVSELVHTLQKTIFGIEVHSNNGDHTLYDVIIYHEIDKYMKKEHNQKTIKTKSLIVSTDVLYSMPFVKFHTHPFLPEKIAKHLKKFYELKFAEAKTEIDREYYVILKQNDEQVNIKLEHPVKFEITNPLYQTVEAYLKEIQELRRLIKDWCSKKGVKDLNI